MLHLQHCQECGAEVPNGTGVEHGSAQHRMCDHCGVANSEACGDWCNESIAAFRRINPNPATC